MKNWLKYPVYENLKFWFLIVSAYIAFINLFVLHATPEILFFEFLFLILVFLTPRIKEFIKDWLFLIGFFMSYEFIRGIIDDLTPFKNFTLEIIYNIESAIFPKIPTVFLQELFGKNSFIISLAFFFYTSFYFYSFATAFVLWLKSKKLFKIYARQFLSLCLVGLIFFFFFPTAPPWIIENNFHIGLERYLLKETVVKNFAALSLYQYFIYGNTVAAFPSLHTAWPAFSSLFLIKHFKSKLTYFSLIIPLMIGFSVIFFGEHFLLDIVFAFWLAYFFVSKSDDS